MAEKGGRDDKVYKGLVSEVENVIGKSKKKTGSD